MRGLMGLAVLFPGFAAAQPNQEAAFQKEMAPRIVLVGQVAEAVRCGFRDSTWAEPLNLMLLLNALIVAKKYWPASDGGASPVAINEAQLADNEMTQQSTRTAPTPEECLSLQTSKVLAELDDVSQKLQQNPLP